MSNPELTANKTYDAAAPAVLIRRIGRRPYRSDNLPQIGEKINCIAENEAMMAPMTTPCARNDGCKRNQRHDDPEPDQIDEDRQENDEDRWLSHDAKKDPGVSN